MSTQRIIDTGNRILTERPKPPMIDMSTFSMSHDVKLSTEMGYLTPACVLECMPGDEWNIQSEALIRCQALISPVMGRLNYRAEWFFMPNRLLWQNWENFISPISEGMTAPVCPNIPTNAITPATHDINDFLGLPTGGGALPQFNCMPHAAYQKIIADWYADQDLVSEAAGTPNVPGGWWTPQGYPLVDGNNIANLSGLCGTGIAFSGVAERNYDRDYFTSAKPWTQKGPVVTIPTFTGPLPVTNTGLGNFVNVGSTTIPANTPVLSPSTSEPVSSAFNLYANSDALNISSAALQITQASITALSGTIALLRQAEALQKFFEADSRGGTRYIEFLLNHFGVFNGDQRLWRAEYLGSSKQPIVISEVLNTTGTATAPQGALAGHGLAVNPPGAPIHYRCSDYGYLMCIVSIVPASGYYQGIHRMFNRQFRLDWPFPEFAHLGEQAILNQELYYSYGASANTQTFGYVPQYAEWRISGGRSCGVFRNSLNFWGVDRQFSSLPTLTNLFINVDTGINNLNRIFATLDQTGHWLIHCFHKIKVRRKLPEYVRPTI